MFPGGGRVRPKLTLAVAEACGAREKSVATAAAAALEMIHCASLVHDDMPAFDNAETRRGKPALFRVYGEQIALLVGDELITLAFEELGQVAISGAERAAHLIRVLARGLGSAHGIIGGQAWEAEETIDLVHYHRAKTGALFEAACVAGAVAANADGEPWRDVGRLLGEAYQLADDLADAAGDAGLLGKPTGQDSTNSAPNAVETLGLLATVERLESRIEAAIRAIPECQGRDKLAALIEAVGHRLCPIDVKQRIKREAAAGAAA
jgi:geranylgeranyl diphosphate synthase type II